MSSKDNNNNKNDDDDKNSEQRSEFMILKSVTSCSKRVNDLHRDKTKYTSALEQRSLILKVMMGAHHVLIINMFYIFQYY